MLKVVLNGVPHTNGTLRHPDRNIYSSYNLYLTGNEWLEFGQENQVSLKLTTLLLRPAVRLTKNSSGRHRQFR